MSVFSNLSSNLRSEVRKIEKEDSFSEEFKKKAETGFTNKKEQQEYEEKFKRVKEEADRAKEKIEKIKEKCVDDNTKDRLVERITSEIKPSKNDGKEIEKISNGKPKMLTDNLSKFKREDRKLVSRILSIIDNILPKELSDNVKRKIIEELNK